MDKLHCTIAAMSCISSSSCRFFCRSSKIASDVCSSICFFPDRIAKWCCEIRRVLRQVLLQLFTGEPTSFTYFTVSVSLFYCYPYVAILLCHVSYSTVTHMSRVKYPLPIAVVCWLSLASRSACLGICCYLYICWVVGKLSHAISVVGDTHTLLYC